MKSLGKKVLVTLMSGAIVSGIMFSGCSFRRNISPGTLSRQDKDSVSVIEREKARGDLTPTEAALAKDSIARDHLLQF